MKKLTAVIFALLFIFQAFYSTAVTYWFYFNRSYIAEKFCINKARPEMKCKGNCYLSKKLKEAETNKNDQTNLQLKEWVSISPFILESQTEHVEKLSSIHMTFAHESELYCFQHLDAIFHPPISA